MIKKLNIFFLGLFIYLFTISSSQANFQKKIIDKYKTVNSLYFDFTQKIGEKVEFGSCYIKYPLFMKCDYPKKKKSIIANGKKFVIIKRRYKKIYHYPLKKTPLFYLLKKENILNLLKNYEPSYTDKSLIEYELIGGDIYKLKIFFDKNSLEIS